MTWSDVYRGSVGPAVWLVLGLPLLLTAGCASLDPRVRDDIVEICQFPPPLMWLHDVEGRVTGIHIRLYLVSGQTDRGVFVPGTVNATLYALAVRPDGSYERKVAQTWAFDERQATDFRFTTPSPMGNSYGLFLKWPSGLALAGREVQLEISYRRRDGHVVRAQGGRFTVPLPQGARARPASRPWLPASRPAAAEPPPLEPQPP